MSEPGSLHLCPVAVGMDFKAAVLCAFGLGHRQMASSSAISSWLLRRLGVVQVMGVEV